MSRAYTAFISYSHRDSQWARWVQRSLENYRVPKTLASELAISRKLGKVFRDREELSTGQNLGDHLTAALDNADNLIVICSPNSKASPWVAKEIEYFKALGRGDRIFCLLVEGGAESLADPLLTDVEGHPLEPLAADPRDEGDGKRLAKLKLISGILDTNLDQLAQRERARRQRLFAGYAGLANVFLIAVGAALYFEQERQNEAAQKALERELGIQNVASMTEFVERTRQYYDKGALKFVSERFTDYLERFEDAELDSSQKVAKAKALRIVAEASYDLGAIEDSLLAHRQSRALLQQAVDESPENLDLAIELAFADFYLAVTYFYEGRNSEAEAPMNRYSEDISRLFELYPEHPVLLGESISAPTALLTLLVDGSQSMSAELQASIDTVQRAVDKAQGLAPNNAEIYYLSQGPMDYAAHAHMKSCEVLNALPYRERAVEYARKAVELDPRNRDYKTNLANALLALGDMQMGLSDPVKAIRNYLETHNLQTELLENDPSNSYLVGRRITTKLQLLGLRTYYPDLFEKYPNASATLVDLKSSIPLTLIEQHNLELLWFGRLAHEKISLRDWSMAATYSGLLRDTASKLTSEDTERQSAVFYALQHAVISKHINSRDASDEIRDYLAHTPEFPNTSNLTVFNSDSCQDRLGSWAQSVLVNDISKAVSIANQSWDLGSRGQEMEFFSRLLNVPFPKGGSDLRPDS
jgi:tetratricopeptide (TPR) repeat protein